VRQQGQLTAFSNVSMKREQTYYIWQVELAQDQHSVLPLTGLHSPF
jgi:hypothetical protein